MSYTPFDDTLEIKRIEASIKTVGMDTTSIDQFRQGIEINQRKFAYSSTQPKLWSGNTLGETSIQTYGQNCGSIEENSDGLNSKFLDREQFSPVSFIKMGSNYPSNIKVEDKYTKNEAVLEPLTIKRNNRISDDPSEIHRIKGNFENAGFLERDNIADPVVLEYEKIQFSGISAFNDCGNKNIDTKTTEIIGGFSTKKSLPFDDTLPFSKEKSINSTNDNLKNGSLISIVLGEESMVSDNKKCSPKGYDHYGNNIEKYGTDSITFRGWLLGS